MAIKFVIGYSKDIFTAKERALFFYNALEVRKSFLFVESQQGYNEVNEPSWFTTIWYNEIEPTPEEKKKAEEKYLFIGSEDIDPNDPNWREKWEALQLNTIEVAHS